MKRTSPSAAYLFFTSDDIQNFPQSVLSLSFTYSSCCCLRTPDTGMTGLRIFQLEIQRIQDSAVVLHFFARKIGLFGVKMTNTVVVLLLVLVFTICGITEGKQYVLSVTRVTLPCYLYSFNHSLRCL